MPTPRTRGLSNSISVFAIIVFLLVAAAAMEPLHAQAACGDGIVDPMESCDDGNTGPGDGCSAACQVEPGYTCAGQPSVCSCADADLDTFTSAVCGGTDCDDANASVFPGASEVCDGLDNDCDMIVDEACGGVCGNGIVDAMENCDDGNTVPGDGCSAVCQVEPGYSCAGQPSVCSCADADLDTFTSAVCGGTDCDDTNASVFPGAMEACDGLDNDCDMIVDEACGGVCGNGIVDAMENCDDGNTAPGDGCSAACQVEPGYTCSGSPSSCFCSDADADGYLSAVCGGMDCDDANFNVRPGAMEACDGLDNDCDMIVDEACVGVCGNGIIDPMENCDDGNTVTGDGCSSICQFEECTTDLDCNNQDSCDGTEICDPMIRICLPGIPLDCVDGDPCTLDFCDGESGGCSNLLTTDSESASGPDGLCNTSDDNPGLYGADGACGGSDDATGDGLCSAIDNCPSAHNPTQQDADNDRQGDACDTTPCPTVAAYVTTQTPDLFKVDLGSGSASLVRSGLEGATGVVLDSSETRLFVIEEGAGRIFEIDLGTGEENEIAFEFFESWGLALNQTESALFVTQSALGQIARVDLPGGAGLSGVPIASGLSGPRGIQVRPGMDKAVVAEHDSGELSEVEVAIGATGSVSLIASGLSGPIGVALNASGTIAYVTEQDSGELSAVTLSGGAISVIASGLADPRGISLDRTGTIAYVAEAIGISAVDLSTGEVTPLSVDIPPALDLDVSTNPTIEMILPDAALGAPGSTVTVPLSLPDVTGRGVLAADVTVEYNPAVLTATAVTPGDIASGCTVTPNLSIAGQAIISVFCTSELTGAGSIAVISFSVVGTPAMGSPLHIAAGILNEGQPSVCLNDGAFVVPVQISGSIAYYRDHTTSMEPSTKPVAGVTVDLLDPFDPTDPEVPSSPAEQATSACDGIYSFPSLMPIRDYQVTPHKANDFSGSIDPFDAALNAQQVVGLTTLTSRQRLAADATGNGTLSSFDSARIAQLAVGLITQLPVSTAMGSDWAFVPVPQAEPNQATLQPFPPGLQKGSITFTPIVESAEDQNFLAILFGDVSGNWQPPGCGAAPLKGPAQSSLQAPSPPAAADGGTLEMPSLTAGPGDLIRVPIKATGVAGAVSFYLDMKFDPSVVSLVKVELGGAVAGFNLTSNTAELGRARLALFRATPLVASGEVAVATFRVIGKSGSSTQLQLSSHTVNEGNISVTANDGAISVSGPGSGGPHRPRKKK